MKTQQAFLPARSANFVYLHLLLYLLCFPEYSPYVLGLGKVQKIPCGLKLLHTTRILGEKVIPTFKSKEKFLKETREAQCTKHLRAKGSKRDFFY